MAKPKNMTPEQEAAWRKKEAEAVRRRRKANPEKHRESSLRWYKANREKHRETNLRWCEANPEKKLKISRKHKTQARAELRPSYVSTLLGLPLKDCTPELIEAKREQLQLTRLINQLKKELRNVE